MAPVLYLIEEIRPDWVLQSEEMGGKEKFWYQPPGENETASLFKFPRNNTGDIGQKRWPPKWPGF